MLEDGRVVDPVRAVAPGEDTVCCSNIYGPKRVKLVFGLAPQEEVYRWTEKEVIRGRNRAEAV